MSISNVTHQEFIRFRDTIELKIKTRAAEAKQQLDDQSMKIIKNPFHEFSLVCVSFLFIFSLSLFALYTGKQIHGEILNPYFLILLSSLIGISIRLWLEGNTAFKTRKREIDSIYNEECKRILSEIPIARFKFLFSTESLSTLKSISFSRMASLSDETWLEHISNSERIKDGIMMTGERYRALLEMILCDLNTVINQHEKSQLKKDSVNKAANLRLILELE